MAEIARIHHIDRDGSCLFNSFSQAMVGYNKADELRQTVVSTILSDPGRYNRRFLGAGMEPDEYA